MFLFRTSLVPLGPGSLHGVKACVVVVIQIVRGPGARIGA
jgi:hypothetical protein